jgi:hypothetical protein
MKTLLVVIILFFSSLLLFSQRFIYPIGSTSIKAGDSLFIYYSRGIPYNHLNGNNTCGTLLRIMDTLRSTTYLSELYIDVSPISFSAHCARYDTHYIKTITPGNFDHVAHITLIDTLSSRGGTFKRIYSDTLKFTVTSATSLAEHQTKQLSIYPNPVADHLQIGLADKRMERLLIRDVRGKLVLQAIQPGTSVDVSPLKGGVYFLQLFYDDRQEVVKVIKQ